MRQTRGVGGHLKLRSATFTHSKMTIHQIHRMVEILCWSEIDSKIINMGAVYSVLRGGRPERERNMEEHR